MDLKYIIALVIVALIGISLVKKLFKLAITIAIICAIYYLYKIFIG